MNLNLTVETVGVRRDGGCLTVVSHRRTGVSGDGVCRCGPHLALQTFPGVLLGGMKISCRVSFTALLMLWSRKDDFALSCLQLGRHV